ncbi:hypothetical protein FHU38_002865 [Saccharomonospora amisosensis]|uniref:Uncharacterized protein n=1 Tax=Saccharomonospora amisosensis TaxID=1128677 RepID=A0A7X5ZRH0_9PSEU|nr:hypothetical protein [Saccharomonospora amisosensis]NIJ12521.1 hypothetical protein [Saccharomonospora amisosensis]
MRRRAGIVLAAGVSVALVGGSTALAAASGLFDGTGGNSVEQTEQVAPATATESRPGPVTGSYGDSPSSDDSSRDRDGSYDEHGGDDEYGDDEHGDHDEDEGEHAYATDHDE